MSFSSYPKYVDFGVYGIDRLPLGWRLLPVKYVGKLKGGAGFPHSKQGVTGGALSFYKVNALSRADSDGCLSIADDTVSEETAAELGAFIFPPGAIVFAKVGAALLLGRIRTIAARACLDNNMMGLVAKSGVSDSAFLRYAVGLVRFDLLANPGAVPSINETQVGDFRLPMPPLSEQLQIASFLDQETSKIDALISEQQRLIELLKEKRQAVISHAITKGLNPDVRMKPSGVEWLGEVPEHWEVLSLAQLSIKITNGYVGPTRDIFLEQGVRYLQSLHIKNNRIIFDTPYYVAEEWSLRHAKSILRTGDVLIVQTGDIGQVACCLFKRMWVEY